MLRQAREAKGVSQRQLSLHLGKSNNYIANIERGTRRLDLVELVLICDQLELNATEFVASFVSQLKQRPASKLP